MYLISCSFLSSSGEVWGSGQEESRKVFGQWDSPSESSLREDTLSDEAAGSVRKEEEEEGEGERLEDEEEEGDLITAGEDGVIGSDIFTTRVGVGEGPLVDSDGEVLILFSCLLGVLLLLVFS